eukprot:scaffold276_cov116-Isochrysis_galbana.AAC.9
MRALCCSITWRAEVAALPPSRPSRSSCRLASRSRRQASSSSRRDWAADEPPDELTSSCTCATGTSLAPGLAGGWPDPQPHPTTSTCPRAPAAGEGGATAGLQLAEPSSKTSTRCRRASDSCSAKPDDASAFAPLPPSSSSAAAPDALASLPQYAGGGGSARSVCWRGPEAAAGTGRVLAVGVCSAETRPWLRARPVPPVPPTSPPPPVLLPPLRRARVVLPPERQVELGPAPESSENWTAFPPGNGSAAASCSPFAPGSTHAAVAEFSSPPRAICVAMSEASGRFGTSTVESTGWPVSGLVLCLRNHRSMAARSNTWPSMVETGSFISARVMGQTNSGGAAAGGGAARTGPPGVSTAVEPRPIVAGAAPAARALGNVSAGGRGDGGPCGGGGGWLDAVAPALDNTSSAPSSKSIASSG